MWRRLDRLPRGGDGEVVEGLGVRVADARAGAHDLHGPAAADRLERREVVLVGEHAARRLEPVLRERALQPAHDGPADAHVRVPPVVGVLGVARPLLGDADAPGHADAAVGDDQPPVGAVLQPLDGVGLGWPEARPLGALDGLEEGGEDLVAVEEELRLVAVGDRGAGQRFDRPDEALRAHVEPRRGRPW
jgi:hypothetical protein